jgi:hypothetical protein
MQLVTLRSPIHAVVLALLVTAVAQLSPASVAAQIDAGLLARARDREIVATYDAPTNRTDVTLTLAPSRGGDAPPVTMMFVGQFQGREPRPDGTSLAVRTHITPRADPRHRDPRTGADGKELIFRIDPHTASGITLYLFSRSYGYGGFVAPGDEIPVAFYGLSGAELKALTAARAITGRALGSEFSLAPDQLAAINDFARRVIR